MSRLAFLILAVLGGWWFLQPADVVDRREKVAESERILTISAGEEVDLGAHLVDSGWTVFEYCADW